MKLSKTNRINKMKTIKWDKFVGMMNDVNNLITIDQVAVSINHFPSKDSFKFWYTDEDDGEVYHFDIERKDNEEIEVGKCIAMVKCENEVGEIEVCRVMFLIPKEIF